EAVRQVDDFLAEQGLLIRWHDKAIGDDVIDEVGTRRTGIAEIVNLDRCRAVGEDFGSAIRGPAMEIDQQIEVVGTDELRRVPIRHLGDVHNAIEAGEKATADRARIILVKSIGDDLEALAVMLLNQARYRRSDWVNVEIP